MKRYKLQLVLSLLAALVAVPGTPAQVMLRNALDFDGDSKADLGVIRDSQNTWFFKLSEGDIERGQVFGVSHTDTFTPGDYDGDGKGDLAVWRYSDATWYRLNSSTGTLVSTRFGLIGDEPIQRDYDGDGKTDIAIVRRAAGANGAMTWWILSSLTGVVTGRQFGLSDDSSVPADYDGDGKFDIAVYRQGATEGAQSHFYIDQSTAGFAAAAWGVRGDWVVTGDYDADGRSDLAVVRRGVVPTENLTWFIYRSSDAAFVAEVFGVTETDSPVQNDYDGDGRTDIAVWRETDGTFYILRSGGGVTATPWGYSTDNPIAAYDTH